MADQFIEGFDKYGPVGMGAGQTSLTSLLTAGEWTSTVTPNATAIQIVAGLSSVGTALRLTGQNSSNDTTLAKTLAANLSRIIGGFRFSMAIGNNSDCAVVFSDGGTGQCAIVFNGVSGTFSLYSGAYYAHGTSSITGSLIATSTRSVSSGTTHYIEWDITIGSSGAYTLWLDGTTLMMGTGNTKGGTTDTYVNGIAIGATQNSISNATNPGNAQITIDDLYVFDSTGSVNNAALNTSPRVETHFPSADSSVQFSATANIVGSDYSITTTTSAPGANTIFLVPVTPAVNCTINSVTCLPEATSAGANFKAVIYSDSSGPSSLLSSGSQVTGCTAGTALTGALTTAQSLTGGTKYWIGFITDTSVVLAQTDTVTASGQQKSNTYSSGAPSTLSGMTTGEPLWLIYGNCSGAAHNYVSENVSPPVGDASYVSSLTSGNEDLYTFPNLSITPAYIYTVAVKAYLRAADGGARTVSLDMKSSSTDSNGSNSGQTLSTSYAWIGSFFDTDPNTSSAWGASGLNAATTGFKIAS